MRYLVKVIIVIALFLIPVFYCSAKAEVVVIVHSASDLNKLTRRQVVDIYTGRMITTASGEKLLPLDHPVDSVVRKKFYAQLVGKSVAVVNAYWARLLFTGRALPPKELADNNSILKAIETRPNTIGYIDIEDINDNVKIVYTFQDHAQ